MKRVTLLVTRPADRADAFLDTLDPAVLARVACLLSPLMAIVPTGQRPDLSRYAAVILTSAQAVALAPPGAGRIAHCVGASTAQAARAAGWQVAALGQTAEELLEKLPADAHAPLLHLAGAHRRGDLAERLTARGITTDVVTLYEQRLLELAPEAKVILSAGGPVIVPLFSPRTAAQFAAEIPPDAHPLCVAMSEAVAAALGDLSGVEVVIAAAPTGQAMAQCVENMIVRATLA